MSDNQTEAVEVRQGNELPNINLQNAIDKAVELGREGVEVLERLEAIMVRQNERQALVAFEDSRLSVLSRLGPIKLDKLAVVNEGFQFWYASLEIQEQAVKDAGALDFGFSWYWDTEVVEGTPMSVCVLNHRDGHSRRSRFPIQRDKRDNRALSEMQKEHVSTSQADRITFMRVWGIVSLTNKDEGGPKSNVETVTDDEARDLEDALRQYVEQGGGDEKAVKEAFKEWQNWAGVRSFSDWPSEKYADTMKKIAQRVKELEATK